MFRVRALQQWEGILRRGTVRCMAHQRRMACLARVCGLGRCVACQWRASTVACFVVILIAARSVRLVCVAQLDDCYVGGAQHLFVLHVSVQDAAQSVARHGVVFVLVPSGVVACINLV